MQHKKMPRERSKDRDEAALAKKYRRRIKAGGLSKEDQRLVAEIKAAADKQD